MAFHLQPLLIFFFFLTITHSLQTQQLNHRGLVLKVTKHPETHFYTTQLLIGTPQLPTTFLIHLSSPSLWLHCPSSSSSRTPIPHRSIHCHMAQSNPPKTKTPTTCNNIPQQNPITKQSTFGDLVHDILTVHTTPPFSTVDRFLFSCAPNSLLNGLGANGVLGLGRSKLAFQSQIVNNFDLPRKLTVCLSSSNGFIVAGAGVLKGLSYTPLVLKHGYFEYYVYVDSIKVNGRRLAGLRPIGAVEISSTVPYTVMESRVYESFIKGYVSAAAGLMNMTVVDPVGPFGVCFKSQTKVPEIELVLQSEMVRWRIQRRNLMVEVSESVMCLGFVDGGLGMNESMILGGYQLEDYVLEFDLGSGMMGFSSSLFMEGNSCSTIRASVLTPMKSL